MFMLKAFHTKLRYCFDLEILLPHFFRITEILSQLVNVFVESFMNKVIVGSGVHYVEQL